MAIGHWGFSQRRGIWRFVLSIGGPALGAVLRGGTFAVPDAPCRSGEAPVLAPGVVRLFLVLALFGFAAWALYDAGQPLLALILAGITAVHHAVSYE